MRVKSDIFECQSSTRLYQTVQRVALIANNMTYFEKATEQATNVD